MQRMMKMLGAALVLAPIVLGSAQVTRAHAMLAPIMQPASNRQLQAPVSQIGSITTVGTVALPAQSAALVSSRPVDGFILSTGNLYFTSHDGATASVWRAAQTMSPGQEILLYSEPGARFGDLVFALVDGNWYGYFFDTNAGVTTIKRVPLTGGAATTLATITNVDVVNSHRNLVTDFVNLYWQDATSVRMMPIRGGAISVLALTGPNTPTAGIALQSGNLIYADVTDIRSVPIYRRIIIARSLQTITPVSTTIVTAQTRVTALSVGADGIFWGEQSGDVHVLEGDITSTLPSVPGLVPTSIGTNGGTEHVITQCGSQGCQLQLDLANSSAPITIDANALGAGINGSGLIFWGDDAGVHRLHV